MIYDDIKEERARQDEQWGGPEHDDTHSYGDWVDFIRKQLGDAYTAITVAEWRSRMVKIAALAVAAVESKDREQDPQKGHP